MLVSDAIEQFHESRKGWVADTTARNDSSVLTNFGTTVNSGRDIKIQNLSPVHVEVWFNRLSRPHADLAGRTRDPITASTWNYYYTRIKTFLDFCSRRGLNRHDPLRYVRPRTVAHMARTQPPAVTLLAMIDNADDPRDRAALALACNLGLRSNEIARLRVGDVDLKALNLRVWVSKSQVEDLMPITSELHGELHRWLDAYAAALTRPLTDADHLVPAASGPRYRWRTTTDGARERYQVPSEYRSGSPARKLHNVAHEALKSVGLDGRGEGMHTLRRAVARHYFDREVECGSHATAIRSVMALLHHSNSATTEHYLGLTTERRTRDQSLRGRSMFGPPRAGL